MPIPECEIMPELPDITLYLRALETHVVGQRLERARMLNAFVLRSVDPPLARHGGAANGHEAACILLPSAD